MKKIILIVAMMMVCGFIVFPSYGDGLTSVPRDTRKTVKAKIVSGPRVAKSTKGYKISFTVSVATDVEVAILNKEGEVVRHLAAGLLGPSAPAPFKKNSLRQTIIWDGNDDRGNKVVDAANVRLRLGLAPVYGRRLGWDGLTLDQNIVAVAVADNGDVYVVDTEKSWGRTSIKVISKDGKYLRTILPFPANTPAERRKDFGVNVMPDGTEVPFVFNAQNGCTQPLVSALRNQDIAIHPAGHLLMTSANGSLSNHGPEMRLIAIHPEGGAPEKTGYIGPSVREVYGFIGGAGNSTAEVYNGLTTSPDGKYIYQGLYSTSWIYNMKNKSFLHGVYRLNWTDEKVGEPFLGKKTPGSDDEHFNMVAGLATDKAGNIYVCDNGNNRIMVFSPSAKLLHKIEVPRPYQVRVHPKTGDIYVLSREINRGSKLKDATVVYKFTPLSKGTPVKVAELAGEDKKHIMYIALDHTATPTRLFAVLYSGWRNNDKLCVIQDNGSELVLGDQINNRNGLCYPLSVSVDEKRNKVYVHNFLCGMDSIELDTGKTGPLGITANEVEVDDDGNIYACIGWAWYVKRFTADKKEKKLTDGNEKGRIGPWTWNSEAGKEVWARTKGFSQGGRGYTFAPNGNLYVIKMPQYTHGYVDVYSPEGKLLKEKLIDNLPYASGGISVDAADNIYIGVNFRPEMGANFFPKGFEKISTEPWLYYKKTRGMPWDLVYYNTYLFYYGGVVKFSPEGGKFYIWRTNDKHGAPVTPRPADAPENLPVRRAGYLSEKMVIQGAEWHFNGASPIPTSGESWGDPSCTCWNIRLQSDPYGRVFIPDCFRFAVNVLDTAGNLITRIGRYGNADDISKGADIFFAWPAYVDLGEDRLYVSDVNANCLTVVDLKYTAEKITKLP